MTADVLSAVESARTAGGGTVRLAAGTYHFRSPSAMRFYVSNHNNPMPRNVFLPLTNLTDVALSGENVDFVFHGEGVGVMIQDCRRTSLRGIRLDYATPWFVETRFESFDSGRPVVKSAPPQFSLAVEGGRLVSLGEGWKGMPRLFGVFDSDTGAFRGWQWTKGEATALGGDRFRIEDDWRSLGFAAAMSPGDVVLVRDPLRPNPAIFVNRSVDTRLEDCVIHSSPGIGLLAQRSENVAFCGSGGAEERRAGSFAKPGCGRLTSLQADATHFSNCKGKVVVENCLFEGMSDDAINVHATCLQIESMPDAHTLVCRYRHAASVGFEVFQPGETLRFIKTGTLEEVEKTVKVLTARMTGEDRVELALDAALPQGAGVGDAVENADWQPSVVFRGNHVRNCTARGALFTTHRRVLCECDVFERVANHPILMEGDAREWYESGGCRDVAIRRNVFRDCMKVAGNGLIHIAPNVHNLAGQRVRYHRNVTIEENEFDQCPASLLYARGVSNIIWRANRVSAKPLFDVAECESVKIDEMRPSPLFRSHMVMQAGKPIRVFGTGDGTAVVRFNGATAQCVASNGTWCATLPPQPYGGPYTLAMDFGGWTEVCDDVYVGDVYIMSGQSNMQFKLEESTTPKESYADVPLMRSFTTPRPEPEPYSPKDGWIVCTRENSGKWSALGYLFGKAISEKKGVAVGIINCYQGAATVETWMPASLSEQPRFALPSEEQDPSHWCYPWNKAGWMYDHAFRLLVGYPVGGVVWYQGESNSGKGEHKVYAELVAELIGQWRKDLLDENLPFAVVQIADLDVRRDDAWKGIQEAQLRIPSLRSGVTTVKCADTCETNTIHPPTKEPLARRLVDWALSMAK
ncbi:MAG: sialate O-acetylesterase [Kiritimatiellae bacterium]|nr:sialate O-acetylesterase [Kiritimatiellia bacterium]